MFGSGGGPRFYDYVRGTWGSFMTPAGRVEYIMTKARLGDESADPELSRPRHSRTRILRLL